MIKLTVECQTIEEVSRVATFLNSVTPAEINITGPREAKALSVAEAAKMLGISAGTVYDLVRTGKLPAIRIGVRRGAIRIQVGIVEAFMREYSSASHRPQARWGRSSIG